MAWSEREVSLTEAAEQCVKKTICNDSTLPTKNYIQSAIYGSLVRLSVNGKSKAGKVSGGGSAGSLKVNFSGNFSTSDLTFAGGYIGRIASKGDFDVPWIVDSLNKKKMIAIGDKLATNSSQFGIVGIRKVDLDAKTCEALSTKPKEVK